MRLSLCGDCVIFGWMCCGWRRRQLCSTTSGCRAASSHPLLTSGSSSDLPAVGAREAGKGLPLTEQAATLPPVSTCRSCSLNNFQRPGQPLGPGAGKKGDAEARGGDLCPRANGGGKT